MEFSAAQGDQIQLRPGAWSFGGSTPTHFEEHIGKSVPNYESGHDLICDIADYFLSTTGSKAYDLGCSTGSLIQKLTEARPYENCQFIGVDIEPGMIELAEERRIDQANFVCSDILNVEIQDADLVIMYYTLQFVPPKVRQVIVDQVFQGLNWGGGFILFEKVRAPDARFQDMMTGLYTDFKLRQGFSEAEIVNKTRSLKGVLEPFSSDGNMGLLRRAGFEDMLPVFKYLSFEGVLAIK